VSSSCTVGAAGNMDASKKQKGTMSWASTPFVFDVAFDSPPDVAPLVAQERVYKKLGQPVLQAALSGVSGCVFAYGQTGSGKTFSVLGSDEVPGLLVRFADELFEKKARSEALGKGCEIVSVKAAFLELYNERLIDLLSSGREPLRLFEHSVEGVCIPGLVENDVSDRAEFDRLMTLASCSRSSATTTMNKHSSRSHALVQLRLQCISRECATRAKIHIVDLAGSERPKNTLGGGVLSKDGININVSLSTLGLVISRLAEIAQGRGPCSVPFRDSKLTFLLKDGFSGNARTHVLITLSPAASSHDESLSSLRFAQTVKRISTRAVADIVKPGAGGGAYEDVLQVEVERLRSELVVMRSGLTGCTGSCNSGGRISSGAGQSDVHTSCEPSALVGPDCASSSSSLSSLAGTYVSPAGRQIQVSGDGLLRVFDSLDPPTKPADRRQAQGPDLSSRPLFRIVPAAMGYARSGCVSDCGGAGGRRSRSASNGSETSVRVTSAAGTLGLGTLGPSEMAGSPKSSRYVKLRSVLAPSQGKPVTHGGDRFSSSPKRQQGGEDVHDSPLDAQVSQALRDLQHTSDKSQAWAHVASAVSGLVCGLEPSVALEAIETLASLCAELDEANLLLENRGVAPSELAGCAGGDAMRFGGLARVEATWLAPNANPGIPVRELLYVKVFREASGTVQSPQVPVELWSLAEFARRLEALRSSEVASPTMYSAAGSAINLQSLSGSYLSLCGIIIHIDVDGKVNFGGHTLWLTREGRRLLLRDPDDSEYGYQLLAGGPGRLLLWAPLGDSSSIGHISSPDGRTSEGCLPIAWVPLSKQVEGSMCSRMPSFGQVELSTLEMLTALSSEELSPGTKSSPLSWPTSVMHIDRHLGTSDGAANAQSSSSGYAPLASSVRMGHSPLVATQSLRGCSAPPATMRLQEESGSHVEAVGHANMAGAAQASHQKPLRLPSSSVWGPPSRDRSRRKRGARSRQASNESPESDVGPSADKKPWGGGQSTPEARKRAALALPTSPRSREGWEVSLCEDVAICYPSALPSKDKFAQRKVPRPVSLQGSTEQLVQELEWKQPRTDAVGSRGRRFRDLRSSNLPHSPAVSTPRTPCVQQAADEEWARVTLDAARAALSVLSVSPHSRPQSEDPAQNVRARRPLLSLTPSTPSGWGSRRRAQSALSTRGPKLGVAAGPGDPDVVARAFDRNSMRRRNGQVFVENLDSWRSANAHSPGARARQLLPGMCAVYVRKRPMFPHDVRRCDFDVLTVVKTMDDNMFGTSAIGREIVHHACTFDRSMVRPFICHTRFPFDGVFDEDATNAEVYSVVGRPLLESALSGQLAGLFMFGQTGSGKTYTMRAIEQLIVEELFARLGCDAEVSLSYFELAGRKALDLLTEQKTEIRLREEEDGCFRPHDCVELVFARAGDLLHVMGRAAARRATDATAANSTSSRSHSVCRVTILRQQQLCGRLLLVDCAGVERSRDTLYFKGQHQRESAEINSSLFALKDCMRLRQTAINRRGGLPQDGLLRLPSVRASPLTKVLGESLVSPSAQLAAIATVSPNATDAEHTLDTLRNIYTLSGRGEAHVTELRQSIE